MGLLWWLSGKECLPMQETWVQSLGQEDPLEDEMANHSSALAWEIPWKEEPGRLQTMGLQKSWTWLRNKYCTFMIYTVLHIICTWVNHPIEQHVSCLCPELSNVFSHDAGKQSRSSYWPPGPLTPLTPSPYYLADLHSSSVHGSLCSSRTDLPLVLLLECSSPGGLWAFAPLAQWSLPHPLPVFAQMLPSQPGPLSTPIWDCSYACPALLPLPWFSFSTVLIILWHIIDATVSFTISNMGVEG